MDFKAIQQLVAFLNRNKIKSVKQLGSGIGQADLSDIFYQKLQSGDFKSDLEAANFFLKKDQKNKSYRELKIRFARHLVDLLFLVDFDNDQHTVFQSTYYNAIKEASAAKLALSKGLHLVAVELAESALKRATKIKYHELIVQSSKILWSFYGKLAFDKSAHDKYLSIYNKSNRIIELEDQAHNAYCHLMIYHFSKKSTLIQLSQMAADQMIALTPLLACNDSEKVQKYTRLVRLIQYSAVYDYDKMLNLSNQDIAYFLDHFRHNKSLISSFVSQNAAATFRLGLYEAGLKTIGVSFGLFPEGHFNWFSISHYKYLIHMHQGDYQAALDTYESVTKHRAFKNLVPLHKENWTISGAYLAMLAEYGKLAAPIKKFKLGKFLNEIPAHAKDKQTRNIPILIVQMLFWLKREQKMKFIDCAEAVEQYVHRNLKRDHVLRYNILIKMLLKIPKQSFHPVAVKRHTRALAQKMQAESFDQAMPFDIEFLPNEVVWDLAMEAIS